MTFVKNLTPDSIFRPTGGVAGLVLFFFLNLNPRPTKSFREHVAEFDFVGLILFTGGILCILFGFNESEKGCKNSNSSRRWPSIHGKMTGSHTSTIVLLVIGCVTLVGAGVNEWFTARSPMIPPRLFKVSVI